MWKKSLRVAQKSASSAKSCPVAARQYSTERPGVNTIPNLAIDQNTRVIYQGFTGRAVSQNRAETSQHTHTQRATANAKDTIAYGTNVVGGVSPGKGNSKHLNLPVYNTVKEVSILHSQTDIDLGLRCCDDPLLTLTVVPIGSTTH
jgi:hypothetical protein